MRDEHTDDRASKFLDFDLCVRDDLPEGIVFLAKPDGNVEPLIVIPDETEDDRAAEASAG